jgi:hypothetical protein
MKVLFTLLVVSLLTCASSRAGPIPSVKVGSVLYSNVVVVEISSSSVMISHARGMASFNRRKLTQTEQEDLGLIDAPKSKAPEKIAEPESPRRRSAPAAFSSGTNDYPLVVAKLINVAARAQPLNVEEVENVLRRLPRFHWWMAAVAVWFYVLFSLAAVLVCFKAAHPAPVLGWVPFFQIFALYRAAKMSAVWFGLIILDVVLRLGLFAMTSSREVPGKVIMIFAFVFLAMALAHLLGVIIWAFKICRVRGKSPAVGILMLVPGVNFVTFLFLAFSEAANLKVVAAKI